MVYSINDPTQSSCHSLTASPSIRKDKQLYVELVGGGLPLIIAEVPCSGALRLNGGFSVTTSTRQRRRERSCYVPSLNSGMF